jgi:hypothetical protein
MYVHSTTGGKNKDTSTRWPSPQIGDGVFNCSWIIVEARRRGAEDHILKFLSLAFLSYLYAKSIRLSDFSQDGFVTIVCLRNTSNYSKG